MLKDALNSKICVISVMGDHAGESEAKIFERKINDIRKIGCTFWLTRSYKSMPDFFANINNDNPLYVIFVSPSKPGGAQPTTTSDKASQFSKDRGVWTDLPEGLGPVTGKLDTKSYTFVFDKLELVLGQKIDLWGYAELEDQEQPIFPKLGCSTICAIRKDMSESTRKLSTRYRKVVAVGRRTTDRCVWVR